MAPMAAVSPAAPRGPANRRSRSVSTRRATRLAAASSRPHIQSLARQRAERKAPKSNSWVPHSLSSTESGAVPRARRRVNGSGAAASPATRRKRIRAPAVAVAARGEVRTTSRRRVASASSPERSSTSWATTSGVRRRVGCRVVGSARRLAGQAGRQLAGHAPHLRRGRRPGAPAPCAEDAGGPAAATPGGDSVPVEAGGPAAATLGGVFGPGGVGLDRPPRLSAVDPHPRLPGASEPNSTAARRTGACSWPSASAYVPSSTQRRRWKSSSSTASGVTASRAAASGAAVRADRACSAACATPRAVASQPASSSGARTGAASACCSQHRCAARRPPGPPGRGGRARPWCGRWRRVGLRVPTVRAPEPT